MPPNVPKAWSHAVLALPESWVNQKANQALVQLRAAKRRTSRDLGDVELRDEERRQERGEAEKAAEGDDVNEIKVPAVFFCQRRKMLFQGLVFKVRRFFRKKTRTKRG